MDIILGWDSCVQGKSEVHFCLSWALILSVCLLAPDPALVHQVSSWVQQSKGLQGE